MTDKRIVQISSASVLAALLIALLIPLGESGRIVAAILLLPAAVLIPFFIKKRNILSINKDQVLVIVAVTALVYVMLYYLSGLKFGFYKNLYGISALNFFKYFIPTAAIIFFSEVVRYVILAQRDKLSSVLCYLSCVAADVLICSTVYSVTTFASFMNVIAGALLPALISNILYGYLSTRYGIYPNLAFRAITTLHSYLVTVSSGISDSILNFTKILLPIAVYLFVDYLYEKKKKFALGNTSRLWRIASKVLTVIVLIIMTGTVMLVSNQFRVGAYVIATESMTGEINRGDVAIYERYDGQTIVEGQVIAFEKNNSVTIHRVVDIKIINGIARYYTKGDTNEDIDLGYITNSSIRGLVNYKIPLLGYPTLWMRSLFKR